MEKVIIDQESLNGFIDKISPGAHVSSRNIDLQGLDNARIKPVGVYGSKERIADLLLQVGAIKSHLSVVPGTLNMVLARYSQSHSVNALLASKNSMKPYLRSGIYFVQSLSHPQVFVIYWPEETTWDDDAVTSVKQNRVIFMRYYEHLGIQDLH